MPHNFMRPFHFWCQKVLPLVFDDSLSYYEVLAKMRDYLNEAIKEINDIGGEFEGVKTQLTQLKTYVDEYFADLDVNQAISDKLDNMVESGEMDAVITPIFAAYANPLFAASVADMVATNFAYANYENNKIYTFNQSTGLYQTTGKEFGGVVSSVDEMEDNDKYYALDSDGMLYSYDFPQGEFVATGLTYGGYRYGVNAMRPISNVYVLTTDSHVYTWNGSEYVDSGVVYGLNNTAFVWRRELSSADDLTLLITDGWYSFKSDSLPMGLPVNMETSDGFAVVYSIPNDTDNSDNVNSESAQDVQTQRTQDIRADSRNKRIMLYTNKGGSWFWDGLTWVNESQSGYALCYNCNDITENSIVACAENCENAPTSDIGLLITQIDKDNLIQWFSSENNVWYRTNSNWIEIGTKAEIINTQNEVQRLNNNVEAFYSNSLQHYYDTLNRLSTAESIINNYIALTTTLSDATLQCENNDLLLYEDGNFAIGSIPVLKTDTSLTEANIPADAKATGEAILAFQLSQNSVNQDLRNTAQALSTQVDSVKSYTERAINAITVVTDANTLTESSQIVLCENNMILSLEVRAIATDTTLTKHGEPADSFSVGKAIATLKATTESGFTATNNNADTISRTVSQIMALTEKSGAYLTSENGYDIYSEMGENVLAETIAIKTDSALSDDSLPANAKATGDRIRNLEQYFNIETMRSVYGTGSVSHKLIVIDIYGELPLTKTNVNVDCKVYQYNTIYNGHAKLKVQGSSSVGNPEKNYTLTLDNNITVGTYTHDKWNLKCNYIDPSQIRNLLCAKLWAQCLEEIMPQTNAPICSYNNDTITTESEDIISTKWCDYRVGRSPHYGCTDGEMCVVLHNGVFHGLYNICIPKSGYMLDMALNNDEWILSASGAGYMYPSNSQSDFYEQYEIEELSENSDEQTIYQKTNAIFGAIANANESTILDVLSQYSHVDIILCYICFSWYINNIDGIGKNYLIYTYNNGDTIDIGAWDMDCTFGNFWKPTLAVDKPMSFSTLSLINPCRKLIQLKPNLVVEMWRRLRANILNKSNVRHIINELCNAVNSNFYTMDFAKWPKGKTVTANVNSIMEWLLMYDEYIDATITAMEV